VTTLRFFLAVAILAAQDAASPRAAVDDLLTADRMFAAGAATRPAAVGVSAAFADDVVMLVPGTGFARGKARAVDALNAIPDVVNGKAEWAPIRGGVSGDGRHGFTVGYGTLTRQDAVRVPFKYVAYWIRQTQGWRVAVYKRVRSAEGPDRSELPPALPARISPVSTDPTLLARYTVSLDAAERAFSDEAQTIGLGPAFAKHGSADAVNVGPAMQPSFVVGAEAIGRTIGEGSPEPRSPLWWAPDDVIVASSGDLGVTIGRIRRNEFPPPGQPATIPFITVWRRATVADPWRYVAE